MSERDDVVLLARREAIRCRAEVSKGSPRDFWLKRLGRYAADLEWAARILRDQMKEIAPTSADPEQP